MNRERERERDRAERERKKKGKEFHDETTETLTAMVV